MRALLVALSLGLGFAPAAAAAAAAEAGVHGAGTAVATASVLVGGRQVAMLGPAGGFTPQQRAQKLRQALERVATPAALSAFAPADVAVVMVDGAPVVTWRWTRLITVTAVDAQLAGQEPGALAAGWARELRAGVDVLRARPGGSGDFVAIVPGTAVFQGGGAGRGAAPPRR